MIRVKKKYIIYRIISGSLSIAAIAYIPYIIKNLIDLGTGQSIDKYVNLILLYFLIIIFGMGFEYLSQMSVRKFRFEFSVDIKKQIFNRITKYTHKEFNEKVLGDYISIVNNDITELEEYYENVIATIQNCIQVLIYAYLIVKLNPFVALVIISSSSLSLLLPKITGQKLSEKKKDQLASIGTYINRFSDLLKGFSLINHQTRDRIQEVHEKQLKITEMKKYAFGKYKTFSLVFNGFFMYILDLSAFAVVGGLMAFNVISLGVAVASLSYIKEFVYPVRYLINNITSINATKGIRFKINDILTQVQDERDIVSSFNDKIQIDNLNVQLNDFNLGPISVNIEKGKKYALIGESGSGKSTFLKTLINDYDLDHKGSILVDGKDIRRINTDLIIKYIDQFDHIYDDTYIENVTIFGSYNYNELPNTSSKLETMGYQLSDTKKSLTLSGGEKKIISLMRGILSNCDILVMDEPFTGLDAQNTYDILGELTKSKKTVLVIIHHATENVLNMFDSVLEFNNGRVDVRNNILLNSESIY